MSAISEATPLRRLALAYVLLFATMAIWGSAFAGIRYTLREISPLTLTAARLAIAGVLMLAVGVARRTPLPARGDRLQVIAAALLGFTIYHLLLNVGADYISAGQASFIVATTPIWTAVLASQFLGERVSLQAWVGLLISMAGMAYMSLGAGDLSVGVGSLLVLVSALCAAGNVVLSKSLLSRYRPLDFSIYTTVIGAIPLLVYGPWAVPELAAMSPLAWVVLLYLGAVPIALGYWLSNVALSILPASRTSQMLLLVPPMAAVIAWLFIDEAPDERLLVGGPLILVGVLLGNVRRRS